MRFLSIVFILLLPIISRGQVDDRITTIEFVEALNGHVEETRFYYQNNWQVLRKKALDRRYIHSYELLETSYSANSPFHFILKTTYSDQAQFDAREEHFQELIKEKGPILLLNAIEPGDFRKSVFYAEKVSHWN